MESETTIPVLNRIESSLVTSIERSRARTRRVRRLTVAFAATLILAAVAIPVGVRLGGQEVARLSTAEALDRVATGAMSDPLPFAEPDQFLYTRQRATNIWGFMGGSLHGRQLDPFNALVTTESQLWVSRERMGARVERRTGVRWVTDAERAAAKEQGAGVFDRSASSVQGVGPSRSYHVGSDRLTREQLERYPTDPSEIYRRVRDGLGGAGQGPADGVWQSLTESLRAFSFPPRLRAGMVRAIGLIPGVRTLGEQKDPLGRTGLAFARVHNNVREVILFDPQNSAVLYSHGELVRATKEFPGWPAGTVTEDDLVYETRVVDHVPASVRARQRARAH